MENTPTAESLIAPGRIFKRILDAVRNTREDIHVDGSPDYQRGLIEGLRLAESVIKTQEGNLACEVTAIRHRSMKKVITE